MINQPGQPQMHTQQLKPQEYCEQTNPPKNKPRLINQLQSKTHNLHNQVQRLNHQLQQSQTQISLLQLKLCEYVQKDRHYQQLLALLVGLFAEVQSLRNRLNQNQLERKKQLQERVMSNKVRFRPTTSYQVQLEQANTSLIQGLQCHHQHIIQHDLSLRELLKTNSYHKDTKPALKQLINQLSPISLYSQQSSSIQSSKSLSSNYSLEDSFSSKYKKHESSPKFVEFQSFTADDRPLYRPLKSQQNNLISLGSFGKISQSKNIDSSQQVSFRLEESQVALSGKENHEDVNNIK